MSGRVAHSGRCGNGRPSKAGCASFVCPSTLICCPVSFHSSLCIASTAHSASQSNCAPLRLKNHQHTTPTDHNEVPHLPPPRRNNHTGHGPRRRSHAMPRPDRRLRQGLVRKRLRSLRRSLHYAPCVLFQLTPPCRTQESPTYCCLSADYHDYFIAQCNSVKGGVGSDAPADPVNC